MADYLTDEETTLPSFLSCLKSKTLYGPAKEKWCNFTFSAPPPRCKIRQHFKHFPPFVCKILKRKLKSGWRATKGEIHTAPDWYGFQVFTNTSSLFFFLSPPSLGHFKIRGFETEYGRRFQNGEEKKKQTLHFTKREENPFLPLLSSPLRSSLVN